MKNEPKTQKKIDNEMAAQEPPVWSMAQQELADNAWREHLQEASI